MTAKEKQKELIKIYLKPTLKNWGYQTAGQAWWKDKGDFFNVINLQKYSWNTKDSVQFRFNIGIALKAMVSDLEKKKVAYSDLTVHLDEGAFLPDRKKRKFGDNQGYSITDETSLIEFTNSISVDFDKYILPAIEKPNSLKDCVDLYGGVVFWGDQLKKKIKELGLGYKK